jgi:hypothetical protein
MSQDRREEIERRWNAIRAAKQAKARGGKNPCPKLTSEECADAVVDRDGGLTRWGRQERAQRHHEKEPHVGSDNGTVKGERLKDREQDLLDEARTMEAEGLHPTAMGAAKRLGWTNTQGACLISRRLRRAGLWPWHARTGPRASGCGEATTDARRHCPKPEPAEAVAEDLDTIEVEVPDCSEPEPAVAGPAPRAELQAFWDGRGDALDLSYWDNAQTAQAAIDLAGSIRAVPKPLRGLLLVFATHLIEEEG